MRRNPQPSRTVDDYIRNAPAQARPKLRELRRIVRSLAPQSDERISYGMPAYFLQKNLVYFAGFARHVGFYPGAAAVIAFKRRIGNFKNAKGSIQFPLDKPLPSSLVKSILKFKLDQTPHRAPRSAKTGSSRVRT